MRILLPAVLLLLASCQPGSSDTKRISGTTTNSTTDGVTRGDARIHLQEQGLTVRNAQLLKEDGSELAPGAGIGIGEKIFCRLTVDGYRVVDGKVLVGASERVTTSGGDVVLDEPDLFATLGPADATDARTVTLRAVITSLNKSIHDFVVSFRVWDKRSKASVSGSFPFHLN